KRQKEIAKNIKSTGQKHRKGSKSTSLEVKHCH
ncbi:MAG: hypothetical protein ACI93H_001108, partial [Psychromonas sp.]